jgi:TolB-like protein
VLYATGAWGFLQGVGYVTELFGWPTELPRVVAFALLTGLPAVIVVAWFHGERGDQRVSGTELTLVTVLFLLGGGAFWAYQQTDNSVERAADENSEPSPSILGDSRPVVAVLPFENRNDLPEDAHFVDGVHDYVLTQLAKVEALNVVARTSVSSFRGSKKTTQQIATALGATVLVEGAVQRFGNRVRVTVQLVDGGSALHLWAEHYDLDLSKTNALEVQSELGVAVRDAVTNRLAGNSSDRRVAASVRTYNFNDGAVAGSVILP